MDVAKLRVPIGVVVAVATAAIAYGVATAQTSGRVDTHEKRIESLEREAQQNRERVLRIEILAEQTNKTVERIERKVSR